MSNVLRNFRNIQAPSYAQKPHGQTRVMSTIDLTGPEVDLVPPTNDDDDASPPPPSDARVLAQQVLGAVTLPEAPATAQGITRTAHEEAYAALMDGVGQLLPIVLPAYGFSAALFSAAALNWAEAPVEHISLAADEDRKIPFSFVMELLNQTVFRAANYSLDPSVQLASKNVANLLQPHFIPELESLSPDPTINDLLDPKQFAKIQRLVGDGPLGQTFFEACSAWAWALLKKKHDPQLPHPAGNTAQPEVQPAADSDDDYDAARGLQDEEMSWRLASAPALVRDPTRVHPQPRAPPL